MMARGLPMQIVNDELVAGLLQVAAMREPMMPSPTNPITSFAIALFLSLFAAA